MHARGKQGVWPLAARGGRGSGPLHARRGTGVWPLFARPLFARGDGGEKCAVVAYKRCMPRKPRVQVAGGLVHIYSRGVNRRTIFLDDLDRELYLALLGGVCRRQGWRCLAYCLMPNHVHVLVETPEPNLSDGVQRLHSAYARAFNERHVRWGHLFGDRFRDRGVLTEHQVARVAAYIAMNPVKAGLAPTADAVRLEQPRGSRRGTRSPVGRREAARRADRRGRRRRDGRARPGDRPTTRGIARAGGEESRRAADEPARADEPRRRRRRRRRDDDDRGDGSSRDDDGRDGGGPVTPGGDGGPRPQPTRAEAARAEAPARKRPARRPPRRRLSGLASRSS